MSEEIYILILEPGRSNVKIIITTAAAEIAIIETEERLFEEN